MSKYIDADKLIAEIDKRLMSVNLEELGNNGSHRVWAYNDVKDIVSSLLPEQPKLKPMNIPSAGGGMSTTPPSYKLDVKPERTTKLYAGMKGDLLAGTETFYRKQPVVKKSNALFDECVENCDPAIMKEVSDNIDKILASEGLEEEISSYWNRVTGYQPRFAVLELKKEDLAKVARHFYELGCTRTAVMYDDIEYNRQRAEEAEISKGLAEEIRKYLLDHNIINHSEEGWKRYAEQVARHFAEWGATHLKK